MTEETERVETSEAGADAPEVTLAAEVQPEPESVVGAAEASPPSLDPAQEEYVPAGPAESAEAPDEETPAQPAEVGEEASAVPEQTESSTSEQAEEAAAAPAPSEQTDDLEAAIEQAGTNFDDEPEVPAASEAAGASGATASGSLAAEVRPAPAVSWIPFLIYDLVWLVFAGVLVWQFIDLEAGKAIYHSPLYPAGLLGGLVLLMVGPVLVLAVWIASWRREGVRKGTTFVTALFRGSVAILVGMVIWWGALLLLDQLRLGALL